MGLKVESKSSGQSLLLICVLLPVFILLISAFTKTGVALLFQHRLQRACDQRVLDGLALQAQALSDLGKLNPQARATILARRRIDKLLAAHPDPTTKALLLITRQKLLGQQISIAAQQNGIQQRHRGQMLRFLNAGLHVEQKPLRQRYQPPLPPGLELCVQKQLGYEHEVGSPLILTTVAAKQRLRLELELLHQNLNLKAQCLAHIKMSQLEGPWLVKISADKAS